ncbi:MAG: methylmalonyl Co-A mutase-associated GTPase MeaB [Bacteroidetes bacterium]|nr:methylmalonyl Co-A mutase-associated GTPase MeaB [Bacteroidota bacterium]
MTGKELLSLFIRGDRTALARILSIVENESPGFDAVLRQLNFSKKVPVIGITGPPGAGKSTLVDGLINFFVRRNSSIGVLAVDPSSPFHSGALLGDRIRMSGHFTDPRVFIRSASSRGAMGGLCLQARDMTLVMQSFGFDRIFIETVGIGQSETGIAEIADLTVLVTTPGSGDEVQFMKSGVIEIADIIAINKSDKPGAEILEQSIIQSLRMTATGGSAFSGKNRRNKKNPVIVKTIANAGQGIEVLVNEINIRMGET